MQTTLFKCPLCDTFEDFLTYNELLNLTEGEQNDVPDMVCKFEEILSIIGTSKPKSKEYVRSMFNLQMRWNYSAFLLSPLVR